MYWRIPSTLGPQDLDNIVSSLSSTCNDTNTTTEQEIPSSDEGELYCRGGYLIIFNIRGLSSTQNCYIPC